MSMMVAYRQTNKSAIGSSRRNSKAHGCPQSQAGRGMTIAQWCHRRQGQGSKRTAGARTSSMCAEQALADRCQLDFSVLGPLGSQYESAATPYVRGRCGARHRVRIRDLLSSPLAKNIRLTRRANLAWSACAICPSCQSAAAVHACAVEAEQEFVRLSNA